MKCAECDRMMVECGELAAKVQIANAEIEKLTLSVKNWKERDDNWTATTARWEKIANEKIKERDDALLQKDEAVKSYEAMRHDWSEAHNERLEWRAFADSVVYKMAGGMLCDPRELAIQLLKKYVV